MPHKRFQTCHAQGVIDAEIAEKGHLWMETIWHRSRRQMRNEDAIIVQEFLWILSSAPKKRELSTILKAS